jgi:hypothetical protein
VPNIPKGQKSIWMHPMALRDNVAQVQAQFSPFRESVILMQDRCTVCTKRTIGSEIALDAPDGTPR